MGQQKGETQNTMKTFTAVLFALVAMSTASAQQVTVTNMGPYLEVRNNTDVGVVALRLGPNRYIHNLGTLIAPHATMRDGRMQYGRDTEVTGVVYEDGTGYPEELMRLKRLRDQINAGGPVDLSGVHGGTWRYMLGLWQGANPGKSAPQTFDSSRAPMTRPIPPGTYHAWTALLFAISAVYDGFPDPTSLYYDEWGHTYIAMAGYPPV